jgi:hypothetical protein
MAIKDIQPPRQHTTLDDDISDTERSLKDIRLWRRLVWTAIYAIVIIQVSLIVVAVAIHAPNWDNAAQVFGTFAIFLIAPGLALLYVNDSPCSRAKFLKLAVSLQRLRIQKKELDIGRTKDRSDQFARYKESMPDLIERYRLVANYNRRIYNSLQAFIIIGALSASTLGGAFWPALWARWTATGLTLAIGIFSAIGSHFKLNERSTEMQKTADLIEIEFRAVEFGIGDYSDLSLDEALKQFVERVERIRAEHMVKKRQLDQPADVRFVDASSVN